MTRTPNPWRRSYLFRIGDAFPADDRLARYVMRLSIALADLRMRALRYAGAAALRRTAVFREAHVVALARASDAPGSAEHAGAPDGRRIRARVAAGRQAESR